jgi:hypothetical protein
MQIAIACSVNTESSFTDLRQGFCLILSILLVTTRKAGSDNRTDRSLLKSTSFGGIDDHCSISETLLIPKEADGLLKAGDGNACAVSCNTNRSTPARVSQVPATACKSFRHQAQHAVGRLSPEQGTTLYSYAGIVQLLIQNQRSAYTAGGAVHST